MVPILESFDRKREKDGNWVLISLPEVRVDVSSHCSVQPNLGMTGFVEGNVVLSLWFKWISSLVCFKKLSWVAWSCQLEAITTPGTLDSYVLSLSSVKWRPILSNYTRCDWQWKGCSSKSWYLELKKDSQQRHYCPIHSLGWIFTRISILF